LYNHINLNWIADVLKGISTLICLESFSPPLNTQLKRHLFLKPFQNECFLTYFIWILPESLVWHFKGR
jgi:hypothetical protein